VADGRPSAVPRWLEEGAAWAWRLLALAALAALVLFVASRLLLVVIPVIVALFLASVLYGPTERLRDRGLPGGAAALLMVVGLIVLVMLALFLIAAPIAAQAPEFGSVLQRGLRQAANAIAQGPFGVSPEALVKGVNDAGRRLLQGGGAAGVLKGAGAAMSVLAAVVLAIVVLFLLLRDGEGIWQSAVGAVGGSGRQRLDQLGRRAWPTVRAYFLGVTTVAAVDAVLIAAALLLVGVPLVLPLAVFTFVAAYFPIVGAIVSGAVSVLVALVTGGIADAAIIAAVVLLVQQLEGNVLYPRIMRGRVSLHPLATILGIAVGGTVAGVVGAFLAVPLLAVGWSTVTAGR
jgi:predicted PurR-regulated permease PerM